MNMMTAPADMTGATFTTTRMPILTALAEHRRLMVALKDEEEDDTPDERALHAIEDDLDGAVPTSLAEAVALLKWALVRSDPGAIGKDAILRGEADPTRADFALFYGEAWAAACYLERLAARETARLP